ncbi:DUF1045 domain-containing protein [uncultured Aquitalea sp.]|uniref:DUF1045 domain-containing protein n=1 Tax=uncultured Aquitalea sp. TaxID=540272 RepID=UPI00260139AC|nr:DUF1045 domain-containing protein [uncultured Aquitalea sp.]
MRYAIYHAPPPDSAFWRAGSAWLGQDAHSGAQVVQPLVPGWSAEAFSEITAVAARYGWHATLKAPFALRDGVDESRLLTAVSALASGFAPFAVDLQPAWLAGFPALRALTPPPELGELAAACVVGLSPLAAPADSARAWPGLDARRQALARRWGYPHVFEHYRFHYTLAAGMAADRPAAQALLDAARACFASHARLTVDRLAVFAEDAPGQPFRYLASCAFSGEVQRHD